MPSQNAELVRQAFLAVSGGDPAAGVALYDPAIELDMSGVAGWPEKRVYRGRAEVAELFRAWADSWEHWHFELEEVRDAPAEEVFVALHEWGTGAGSGATVDQRRYFVLTVREGRAMRMRMFSDRGEALEAVGLTE